MPIAIYFAVEAGRTDKALVWVLIVAALSFGMLYLLNVWKDRKNIRQKSCGKSYPEV